MVTVLDAAGRPLTQATLVVVVAAVQRGECVQVDDNTFRLFDNQDFRIKRAHQKVKT